MTKFAYKAKDPSGQVIRGTLDSSDERSVSIILRSQGLFVIDIETSLSASLVSSITSPFRQKVGFSETVNFTRQLSVMITSGLTLTEALTSLRNQMSNQRLEIMLSDLLIAIEGGSSFASALARHRDIFPDVYIEIVKSGEASGLLDKMLNRLADNLEKEQEFRGSLKGALIYPIVILIGVVIVVAIMLFFVIPQMSVLYEQLSIELPLPTRIVIGVSNFLLGFWYIIAAIFIGGLLSFSVWRKTEVGKYVLDSFILKLPGLGKMQKDANLAEISRTLSLLIGSGAPIIESLVNVAGATKNMLYKKAILRAAKKVEKGLSFSLACSQEPILPPLVAQMARVGEETGKLDETMIKMSTYFENETNRSVKTFSTILEPVTLAVLGVVVGFLMISVIMPIYSLTQAL